MRAEWDHLLSELVGGSADPDAGALANRIEAIVRATEKENADLKREADRMRGALIIAAERLRVAASRVERADTEFGLRRWADEADAAALSPVQKGGK